MSSNSETSFQPSWQTLYPWVRKSKLPGIAECTFCGPNKQINFTSMGRTALTSHEKSAKHKGFEEAARKSETMDSFISSSSSPQPGASSTCSQTSIVTPVAPPSTTVSSSQPAIASQSSTSNSSRGRSQFHGAFGYSKLFGKSEMGDSVTLAEAIWCLNAVVSHSSLRKTQDCVLLFSRMFPDSSIASEMKLGKDNVSYSITYGLAPHLKTALREVVQKCEYFVVGFDESLNRVAQKQQMDIGLRYWDEETNRVKGRYFTSEFLEKSEGEYLLASLKNGLFGFDLKKVLQFSMDGPNVNWKVSRLFTKEMRADSDSSQLLELGSCGLHVVNNAFKVGKKNTEWELFSFFIARYYLLKDSPTRRGKFKEITKCEEFPSKFCSVRWLENANVAKKDQKLLPHLKKYVESVEGTKDEPTCISYRNLKTALGDKLLLPKLAFFQSVAEDVEPFLLEFQSESPLAPFLYGSLLKMLKSIMERFVKPDVLNSTPLQKIDVMKRLSTCRMPRI